MLKWLQKAFNKKARSSAEIDDLGSFEFESGIGWRKTIRLDSFDVEIVIGSSGELPSQEMIETARMWKSRWNALHQQAIEFIQRELATEVWADEPDHPRGVELTPQSIEILWEHEPTNSMIFFQRLNDERAWHVTFRKEIPIGFAFDH